jgi:hypothetical protein
MRYFSSKLLKNIWQMAPLRPQWGLRTTPSWLGRVPQTSVAYTLHETAATVNLPA